jgi:hypothetical protein
MNIIRIDCKERHNVAIERAKERERTWSGRIVSEVGGWAGWKEEVEEEQEEGREGERMLVIKRLYDRFKRCLQTFILPLLRVTIYLRSCQDPCYRHIFRVGGWTSAYVIYTCRDRARMKQCPVLRKSRVQ